MTFDENFTGFRAIGDVLYFQNLYGEQVQILTCPPDLDSHTLATALNDASNGVLRVTSLVTEFKF